MKTGMLWFDNDPKADLATKIARASITMCANTAKTRHLLRSLPHAHRRRPRSDIEIRPNRQVLPNHLWMACPIPYPLGFKT